MIEPVEANSIRKLNRERLIVRSTLLIFFGLMLAFSSLFVRFGVQNKDYHPEKLDLVDSPPNYNPDQRIVFKRKLFFNRWTYIKTKDIQDPTSKGFLESSDWELLDGSLPLNKAEKGFSNVWLKSNFNSKESYKHPAIVLGRIPDYHRVYLNGHFVGGSNYAGIIPHYAFDKKLLKKRNVILVNIQTKARRTEPIMSLTELGGSYITEFSEAFSATLNNILYFHIERSVLLFLSLLLFAGCLLFFLFNRVYVEYLYFGMFFLLASANILKSNFLFYSVLSENYLTFIKVFSIFASLGVLFSAYLRLKKQGRLEIVNNLSMIAVSLSYYILIVANNIDVVSLNIWELSFTTFNSYYGLFICFYMIWGLAKDFDEDSLKKTYSRYTNFLKGLLAGTVILATIYNFSSTAPILADDQMRVVFRQIGIFYTAFFGVGLMVISLGMAIWNTRLIRDRQNMSRLLIDLSHTVFNSSNLGEEVKVIQEKICKYLNASRSTIYLLEDSSTKKSFKAEYVYGPWDSTKFVNHLIPTSQGLMGHVFKNKSPLHIESFAQAKTKYGVELRKNNSFRTEACMLFPLKTDSEFIGILTVADPVKEQSFTSDQFALMQTVAKDIALILRQVRVSQGLHQQLSGVLRLIDSEFAGYMSERQDEVNSRVWFTANFCGKTRYQYPSSLILTSTIFELFRRPTLELDSLEIIWRDRIFKVVDEGLGFESANSWIGEAKRVLIFLGSMGQPVEIFVPQFESQTLVLSELLHDYKAGVLSLSTVDERLQILKTTFAFDEVLIAEAYSHVDFSADLAEIAS